MIRKDIVPVIRASQVTAFRLVRHHLAEKTSRTLAEVCGDVCGIQAQLMTAARMALWARMRSISRRKIEAALWESRSIVKTHCMRQTLHLIPAMEFSTYLTAVKPSRFDAVLRVMSRVGVTPKDADALVEALLDALRDGPMTHRKLGQAVKPRVSKSVRGWMAKVSNVARPAVVQGLICYGPDCGNEITLVRTDQWLPKQKQMTEPDAKGHLLLNYLRAYGPATPQDFCKWSGIPMREVAPIWNSILGELAEISVEGEKGWARGADLDALAHANIARPNLRLLPAFDCFLLAHASKGHLVEDAHYKRVYRKQWWISAVVLLDGRIIGTWEHARRGKGIVLRVRPFEKFGARVRSLIEEQSAGLGKFLEAPTSVEYAT